jgi:hypothetical protein
VRGCCSSERRRCRAGTVDARHVFQGRSRPRLDAAPDSRIHVDRRLGRDPRGITKDDHGRAGALARRERHRWHQPELCGPTGRLGRLHRARFAGIARPRDRRPGPHAGRKADDTTRANLSGTQETLDSHRASGFRDLKAAGRDNA